MIKKIILGKSFLISLIGACTFLLLSFSLTRAEETSLSYRFRENETIKYATSIKGTMETGYSGQTPPKI